MVSKKKENEHQFEGLIYVEGNVKRPLARNIFKLSDPTDHRAIFFWFLEFTTMVSFVFWLIVATYLARIQVSFNFSATGPIQPVTIGGKSASFGESFFKQVSVDVWFALSLTVAMDSLAVVFTFNRALIRRFHYVVSQRMMLLACILSYGVFSWNKGCPDFVSRHLIKYLATGFATYMFIGSALDLFERQMFSHEVASRLGTLAQYSKELGHSEISWMRSLFLTTVIGGVGLTLTMLISPPWSALIPVVHIAFESIFLSAMNAKRTSRYLILCSPPFFATICVHWGVTPLLADPRLSISPTIFVALLLLSRLLLDAHLWTTLRTRSELQWARKNAVMSTPSLLGLCIVMALLECIGVTIVTYIKPVAVVLFFGLGSAGFLAIAAYDVSARIPP